MRCFRCESDPERTKTTGRRCWKVDGSSQISKTYRIRFPQSKQGYGLLTPVICKINLYQKHKANVWVKYFALYKIIRDNEIKFVSWNPLPCPPWSVGAKVREEWGAEELHFSGDGGALFIFQTSELRGEMWNQRLVLRITLPEKHFSPPLKYLTRSVKFFPFFIDFEMILPASMSMANSFFQILVDNC